MTGDGTKRSARGLLRLVNSDGAIQLIEGGSASLESLMAGNYDSGLLLPLFRDGKLLRETTLHDIRLKMWGWDDTI
ncbi:hypothetical protein D3C86_2194290 [compost metagenome]